MPYKFKDGSVFNTVLYALNKLETKKAKGEKQVYIDEMIMLMESLCKISKRETFGLTFGVKHEITEMAKKAAKAKQSPYEKAGTIDAVNSLLAENREMFAKRGWKASLNKLILDMIAENKIPTPNTAKVTPIYLMNTFLEKTLVLEALTL